MIAALVMAATLSSDSIGTFFTMPEWMPGNVASANTPGSDPSFGDGGWYVAEVTNILNDVWDVSCNGTTFRQQEQIYSLPAGESVMELTVFELAESAYREVLGGTNAISSTGIGRIIVNKFATDVTYEDYIIEEYGDATRRIDFTMRLFNRGHEEVQTDSYVPRSPRLTTDVMAGVYSTFEAYCERQYFALQGQSNVWDTAVYGPRNGYRRFWFDPHTNGCEFVWDPFSHTSSNRTVKTRRLVEYGNIDKLAHYMRNKLCGNSFVMFGARRPGWVNACENESLSYYDHGAWWGTTDTSIFSDQRIVPELVWVRDPTYSIRDQWKGCSMCLGNLSSDFNVWEMSQHNVPLYKMMEKLDFGQTDYYPSWCYGGVVTNTVRDQIEASYPHADGWAITNDTRRLFSDRLCCINQVLGLMDRTFHEPEIGYPTTGTNTTYRNRLNCNGVTSVVMTWNESSECYDVAQSGSIAWGASSTTNYISEYGVESSGLAYHRNVSKTGTGTECVFGISSGSQVGPITPDYGLEYDLVYEAVINGLEINDGDFVDVIIQYEKMERSGIVARTWVTNRSSQNGDYYASSKLFEVDFTNMTVSAFFTYDRQYHYDRTIGDMTLGPNQPGFQAGSRFKSAKAGRVIGMHRKSGNVSTSLSPMAWSQYSQSEYCSDESPYSSRSGLIQFLKDSITKSYNRFVIHYGFSPTAWQSIIPIDIYDANRVMNSIEIKKATLSYDQSYVCYACGYYSSTYGGLQDVTFASFIYPYLDYEECWRAIAVPDINVTDYTKYQPSQIETGGLATDTKVGIMTRVDWDWKTLKRTEY